MTDTISPVVSPNVALYTIHERTETLFRERLHANYTRTDKVFVGLLLFQWLIAILIACWVSPLSWAGTTSQVHIHVWAALLLGGATLAYPLLLAFTRPGSTATRHAIAIAQMLFSTLLIHLTGGRIETHFHIFGSLAFLAFYRDWRVLLTASAVTAADHFLRGLLLPQSIYGVVVPGTWRWVEHAGWVVFEDVFLFLSIAQSKKEMQDIAQRQAQLESAHASVEAAIVARTSELKASEQRLNEAQHVAGIGSWEHDLATGTIRWSAEMFRLYRFDPAEGAPSIERMMTHIYPNDRAMYQRLFAENAEHGEHFAFDLRLLFEDGTLTWGHIVGNVEQDTAGRNVRWFGTFMDITAQKQMEMALRKSQEKLNLAQQVAQLGSWEYDLVTGSITWSPEMFRLLDLDAERGAPDYSDNLALYSPEDAALLDACVQQAVNEGKDYELDLRRAAEEGQPPRWYHAVGKVIKREDGQIVQIVGTLTDITARKQLSNEIEQNLLLVQEQNVELEWQQHELAAANAHLEALATTDGLTGAKNHRAFQEKLREEFNRGERTHCPFSVILLDVDKFKTYNDTYGHPEGDRVLKQVVRVLQETARKTDFVARYGGEEFIILLLETGAEGAMEAAERFRQAIEAQEWPLRQITASFGVSTLGAAVETGPQLIDTADKALYASKAAGRNRVTHADILGTSLL